MEILLFNFSWMTFNVVLAYIPVLCGKVMLEYKSGVVKLLSGFVWLIFLPNTVYLLTDITHFFEDIVYLKGIYLAIDIIMYTVLMILGILTFIFSLYPFEKLFFSKKSKNTKKKKIVTLYALNLLVGFGVVLGRIQRANSWEVITDTEKVILSVFKTLSSFDLMLLVVAFAILCHIIYISFGKIMLKVYSKKW